MNRFCEKVQFSVSLTMAYEVVIKYQSREGVGGFKLPYLSSDVGFQDGRQKCRVRKTQLHSRVQYLILHVKVPSTCFGALPAGIGNDSAVRESLG